MSPHEKSIMVNELANQIRGTVATDTMDKWRLLAALDFMREYVARTNVKLIDRTAHAEADNAALRERVAALTAALAALKQGEAFATQATIAQRDAQVAEWQREYVDQGKRFSAATERQIDTFKRLVREKIELREQLAARDAEVERIKAWSALWKGAAKRHRRASLMNADTVIEYRFEMQRLKAELKDMKQLAARDAQVAELTAALEELTDSWHDTAHGVEESVEAMRGCQEGSCRMYRKLLARTPAATEQQTP